VVRVPQATIGRAEDILSKHLSTYGPDGENGGGLKLIGGDQWWRIRGRELEGEWIEVSRVRVTDSLQAANEVDAKGLSTPDVREQSRL
jgi:hypothetical protein